MSARAGRAALSVAGIVGAAAFGTVVCRLVAGFFVPSGAFLQAVIYGLMNAMFAVGLVLIYRASRIVNFAQSSLGVLAAVAFFVLSVYEKWSFWFAFPAALALAALTGLVVELFVVRRLAKAPRLALTVVTIGVGQVLVSIAGFIPAFFADPTEGLEVETTRLVTPFASWRREIGDVFFDGNHLVILSLAVVAFAALAGFFRFSNAGIAIRGAAENDDRAALLGINVNNLSSLVWVIAASLSGLAAVLGLTVQAGNALVAIGTSSAAILLRALAAAVVARMENLPVTVAASIAIAVFEQAMFWAFDTTALIDAALLVLIVVVLLLQKVKLARADEGMSGTWAANVEIRGIPYELQNVATVRTGKRRLLYGLVAVTLAYPWVMSPAQTSLGSVYVIYGIVVISLVVLTGWGGQISLGQFAFVATGAVIGGTLTSRVGLPFLPALLVASALGAGVAVVIGLPAMKIRGLFLAVTTLAFAVATATVVLNPRFFGWLLPGAITRPKFLFVDSEDERVYFYMSVAGLLFALWVAQGLRRSRAGRVLIAMRENERTAQAYAINRVRTRLATFAISGFLASFAGVLLAHQQHSVRANAFGPEQSIGIFLIAVIGGLGSLGGSLVGLLYVAAIDIFVQSQMIQMFATGAGVVLILLFYPGGLGGLVFLGRDAWLRRVAMRERIFVPSLIGDFRVLDGEHTRAALAPRPASRGPEEDVPVRYRVPSAIGVRGESQQSRRWRYQ